MTTATALRAVLDFEPFKGRMPELDKLTRVHRNLNRPGVWWSLTQNGKVVGHARTVGITHAHVRTSAIVQSRIAAGAAREVHAWVTGYLCPDLEIYNYRRVHYRPHESPDFRFDDDNSIFDHGTAVVFDSEGMWVAP